MSGLNRDQYSALPPNVQSIVDTVDTLYYNIVDQHKLFHDTEAYVENLLQNPEHYELWQSFKHNVDSVTHNVKKHTRLILESVYKNDFGTAQREREMVFKEASTLVNPTWIIMDTIKLIEPELTNLNKSIGILDEKYKEIKYYFYSYVKVEKIQYIDKLMQESKSNQKKVETDLNNLKTALKIVNESYQSIEYDLYLSDKKVKELESIQKLMNAPPLPPFQYKRQVNPYANAYNLTSFTTPTRLSWYQGKRSHTRRKKYHTKKSSTRARMPPTCTRKSPMRTRMSPMRTKKSRRKR